MDISVPPQHLKLYRLTNISFVTGTMKLKFYRQQLIVTFFLSLQRNLTKSYHQMNSPYCINSILNIVKTHMQIDSEIRQIMLFINKNIEYTELMNMRILPTIVVGLENPIDDYVSQLKRSQHIENPRATLFIITIQSMNHLLKVSELGDFLQRLIPAKRRPKILILEKVRTLENHTELFTRMWSRNFLDVTILEYGGKIADYFSLGNDKIIRQLYYNPFSMKLVINKVSLEQDLFPDKLRNLHAYPLKIGFFHYPPYVRFFRNSKGRVINVDGFDVATMKSVADARNFKLVEYLTDKTTWDVGNCKKELNIGFAYDLMLNKIQFIGVQAIRPVLCFKDLMEMATNFQMVYNYAVVPRPSETIIELSDRWKLFHVLTYFGLLMSVLFASKTFGFNSNFRQITYLLAMSLGWCVPIHPRTTIERIIMGSMLVTCFFLSSDIFSTFTSVSLPITTSSGMENLDDLFASNFLMYVHPNLHSSVAQTDAEAALKFYNRAVVMPIIDDDCIEYLAEYKNISCMIRGPRAVLAVRDSKKKNGKLIIKMINEYAILQPGTILMEAGSPYVKCLEDVLVKLGEGGIYNKWYGKYFNAEGTDKTTLIDTVDVEGKSDSQLKQTIGYILALGYSSSALVFIGEIVYHHFDISEKLFLLKVF